MLGRPRQPRAVDAAEQRVDLAHAGLRQRAVRERARVLLGLRDGLKPGIGIMRPARAPIQASAPCASVRPSAVSASRIASSAAQPSSPRRPLAVEGVSQLAPEPRTRHAGAAAARELAAQQAHRERAAADRSPPPSALAQGEHLRRVLEHVEVALHGGEAVPGPSTCPAGSTKSVLTP